MLVKPKPQKNPKDPVRVVRDPRTLIALPPEGKRVPDSSYWVRRLNAGDVVKTTAEDIAKGKAKRLGDAKAEVQRAADDVKAKESAAKATKPATTSSSSGE